MTEQTVSAILTCLSAINDACADGKDLYSNIYKHPDNNTAILIENFDGDSLVSRTIDKDASFFQFALICGEIIGEVKVYNESQISVDTLTANEKQNMPAHEYLQSVVTAVKKLPPSSGLDYFDAERLQKIAKELEKT